MTHTKNKRDYTLLSSQNFVISRYNDNKASSFYHIKTIFFYMQGTMRQEEDGRTGILVAIDITK